MSDSTRDSQQFDRAGAHDTAPVERATDRPVDREEVRRERFGGMNLGAAFFGWLVSVAVSVLLVGIIGAVLAAIGNDVDITQGADDKTIGTAAAIVLLVVLAVGYYCGGYVAGRMSRYSGPRQGFGVWLVSVVVAIVMFVLGAVFGRQYDVLDRVDLPRLPVSADQLSTGAIVAAVIVLVVTLLAAIAGGGVGTHYHRRVDRAGL